MCAPSCSVTLCALTRPCTLERQPLPPFELESFLRDEAKIDAEGVKEYLPLLKKNKIDEEVLKLATDADLKEMGIDLPMDRAKLLDAAKRRTSGKH